jgi:hypothetical protein
VLLILPSQIPSISLASLSLLFEISTALHTLPILFWLAAVEYIHNLGNQGIVQFLTSKGSRVVSAKQRRAGSELVENQPAFGKYGKGLQHDGVCWCVVYVVLLQRIDLVIVAGLSPLFGFASNIAALTCSCRCVNSVVKRRRANRPRLPSRPS